jgi:hypothetical protein
VTQGITAAPAPQLPFAAGAMPTTGRWGWYQDHEGAIYRRVSTLVKEVETDNYNLDNWKLRQVLIGAARRDDLIVAVKSMGAPDPATGWTREQKKLQDELAEKAMEAAKDSDGAITGTAVHTLTERVDRGEPIDQVAAGLPAGVAQSLRAYAGLRELNGWQTIEIERTVICDELEVGGTFDRVDLVPGLAALLGPGTCQHGCETHTIGMNVPGGIIPPELPVVVDVKTEKDPTLNGLHIGPQLAIYSRARRMWRPTGGTHDLMRDGEIVRYASGDPVQVPNGEYVPAPCVRQDVAIVVHVLNGDANPLFVNLTEGWEAAQAAYEQINRKARAKRRVGAAGAWFVPVPNMNKPRGLDTFVQTAVAADYANPNRPGAGQVGEIVTVGGIEFTREVAAAAVASDPALAFGADGRTLIAVPEQVAVKDPATGLVSWQGDVKAADDAAAAKDVVRGQLVEAIWKARTVAALGILWNMAKDRGVPWAGPIAMAGEARKRQIECPQRPLHTGAGVTCACGWMSGQLA